MTTEEKLISMLQPKDYKSKIKLYTNNCKLEIIKSNGETVNFVLISFPGDDK